MIPRGFNSSRASAKLAVTASGGVAVDEDQVEGPFAEVAVVEDRPAVQDRVHPGPRQQRGVVLVIVVAVAPEPLAEEPSEGKEARAEVGGVEAAEDVAGLIEDAVADVRVDGNDRRPQAALTSRSQRVEKPRNPPTSRMRAGHWASISSARMSASWSLMLPSRAWRTRSSGG
jgi:hypothetical protein